MNINTIISRLRALRIDMLLRSGTAKSGEAIKRLEARQFSGMHVRLARGGKMATRNGAVRRSLRKASK